MRLVNAREQSKDCKALQSTVSAQFSQAKIRFQSFFMLITVQPLAFASS